MDNTFFYQPASLGLSTSTGEPYPIRPFTPSFEAETDAVDGVDTIQYWMNTSIGAQYEYALTSMVRLRYMDYVAGHDGPTPAHYTPIQLTVTRPTSVAPIGSLFKDAMVVAPPIAFAPPILTVSDSRLVDQSPDVVPIYDVRRETWQEYGLDPRERHFVPRGDVREAA